MTKNNIPKTASISMDINELRRMLDRYLFSMEHILNDYWVAPMWYWRFTFPHEYIKESKYFGGQ